jgi:DnaK suppressor protein
MTKDQLAHFKNALLDERTRVEAERAAYVHDERDESAEEASGELSHTDVNDPADEGTNLMDRDRNYAAEDNMGRILGKIERALQKIEDGTYGLSDIDGTPIPIARLQALPYAVTTVEQETDL